MEFTGKIIGIIHQVKSTSEIFKKINGAVIAYLGISFVLMSLTERPSYFDLYDWRAGSVFVGVLVLTMLNPVTIVCYTGVFNAKLADLKMSVKDLFFFGFGKLFYTFERFFPGLRVLGINALRRLFHFRQPLCFHPALPCRRRPHFYLLLFPPSGRHNSAPQILSSRPPEPRSRLFYSRH